MNYYEELGIDIKGRKRGEYRIGTKIRNGHRHKRLWHNDNQVTDTFDDTVFYKLPVDNAEGNVLLSGLGLGVLPNTLAKLDKIDSITVIERSPEVIEMIKPYLINDKITVVSSDILEYIPDKEYDYCFIDIWSDDNRENRDKEKKLLLKNLKPYCKKIDFCQPYKEAVEYVDKNILP